MKATITITIDGDNITVSTGAGGGGKVRAPSGEFIPPGGSTRLMPGKKGQAGLQVGQAEMSDLTWWRDNCAASIDDPDKARFRDKNRDDLEAMEFEIARRSGGADDTGGGAVDDQIPFGPWTLP